MIEFNIVSIFPEIFSCLSEFGIIAKGLEKGLISILTHDLRNYSNNSYRKVDDSPYGGGSGMVMMAEPLIRAITHLNETGEKGRVILTNPQGSVFNHKKAKELANEARLIIICARYEGVDERVRLFVDDEISIGDYILTGGEIPAMAIVDAVSRMVPGVVGKMESVENDSFFNDRLDYPHYTRPKVVNGLTVPEVLLSGDHAAIAYWRRRESFKKTLKYRPDLINTMTLSKEDKIILDEIKRGEG